MTDNFLERVNLLFFEGVDENRRKPVVFQAFDLPVLVVRNKQRLNLGDCFRAESQIERAVRVIFNDHEIEFEPSLPQPSARILPSDNASFANAKFDRAHHRGRKVLPEAFPISIPALDGGAISVSQVPLQDGARS